MCMRKYLKLGLFLILIIPLALLVTNSSNKASNFTIDEILKSDNYSYLPEEAKEYVKDIYDQTGEVILTEKNKKENTPYLNPQYVSYLTLNENEKADVDVIPETLITDYVVQNKEYGATPSSFDLRNVNGKNFISPLKNQGSLGICWAFAGAEQAESYLMVKNNTSYNSSSEIFSPRQLDYATSTDGINYYENENGYRALGDGGNFYISSVAMSNGISLIPESKMPYNYSMEPKELYEVLNYGNSKYEVDSTIMMPELNDNYTANDLDEYTSLVKSYIQQYGGAVIGTGSPDAACGSKNTDGRYIISDNSDCNSDDNYSGHAMQIIGWDDNYNYSYCLSGTKHYDVNSSGGCNTGTLKTGTGAYLVRNSWGNDADFNYVYMSYDSNKASIGFITSLSSMASRNWDNNYHNNPWASGTGRYSIIDAAQFTKKISGSEKLTKVKFINLSQNAKFRISVRTGTTNYNNITEVTVPMPGIYTVDLSSYNIILDSDDFYVTVMSSNMTYILMSTISAFTTNVTTTPVIETDDVSIEAETGIMLFPMYSSTKNIPSNEEITYKLYHGTEDVSQYLEVYNNVVAENNVNAYLGINSDVGLGEFTLVTEYGGESYSSIIEIEGVTVTKPDGTIEIKHYNDTYNLGVNNEPKANENGAVITFDYQDGETPSTTDYVLNSYTPNGFLVNGVRKNNNTVLTLTENITINYNYDVTRNSPVFPEPEREGYVFAGWYDETEGGNLVTSYNGENNITLYAHWEEAKPTAFDVDSNNLQMMIGDIHQIEVTFTPENTTDNLVYSGYDSQLISVTNEGLITALSPGQTTIVIALESNGNISKTIEVNIMDNEIISDVVDVETKDIERVIIGEEPETTIDNFLGKLDNPVQYLKVYNSSDQQINDTSVLLKTGMKVKLVVNNQEYDEAIVIIRGDIDEDGLVEPADNLLLKDHLLKKSYITGYRLYAADLDEEDGVLIENAITPTDNNKLMDYLLKKSSTLNG